MRELKYTRLKTEDEIIFLLENDDFFKNEFQYDYDDSINKVIFISENEEVFVSLGNQIRTNEELRFFITDEDSIILEFEII